jgi:endoglucanase
MIESGMILYAGGAFSFTKNLSMKHLLLLTLFSAILVQGQKTFATPPVPCAPPTAVVDTVPRLIQAEKYTADTGALVAPTTDTGGGYELDSIETGDRVDYELWVPFADTYTASFRVATAGTGASFLVVNYSTGAVLDTVVLPNTGGLGSWQTVTVPLTLPYGYVDLRILGGSAMPLALNWIDIEMPPPPPASQAVSVPGMVQAETYISMHGVATQPTTDIGHGLNVGWIDLWDWMNYYVNIPSPGYYTFSFRVSTPHDHAQFLVSDLTDKQQMFLMAVPNTGGFQNWTTVTWTYYFPSSGPKVLQLQSAYWDIWNINWFYVQQGYPFGGAYGGAKIAASNYTYESGVQLQWTSDTVVYENVYNVGWIDIFDWMNYYIYVPQGGPQTASFRVATPYDSASFQVLDNNANVLATVHVPNTGGFQNWQTVRFPINLPAGRDTLWVMSTSWNIWNFHWLEFDPVTDTSAVTPAVGNTAGKRVDSAFAANTLLWPNPVRDVFTIQMNDGLAGKMVVQVVDGSGVVRLEMNDEKTPGVSVFTIPAGSLLPGVYFVRIMVADQLQVRKLLKL